MATPNEYTLKGKLQIVFEGRAEPMELGEVEIPVRVDFQQKPPRPGLAYRGEALPDGIFRGNGSGARGNTNAGLNINDHASQRDGI